MSYVPGPDPFARKPDGTALPDLFGPDAAEPGAGNLVAPPPYYEPGQKIPDTTPSTTSPTPASHHAPTHHPAPVDPAQYGGQQGPPPPYGVPPGIPPQGYAAPPPGYPMPAPQNGAPYAHPAPYVDQRAPQGPPMQGTPPGTPLPAPLPDAYPYFPAYPAQRPPQRKSNAGIIGAAVATIGSLVAVAAVGIAIAANSGSGSNPGRNDPAPNVPAVADVGTPPTPAWTVNFDDLSKYGFSASEPLLDLTQTPGSLLNLNDGDTSLLVLIGADGSVGWQATVSGDPSCAEDPTDGRIVCAASLDDYSDYANRGQIKKDAVEISVIDSATGTITNHFTIDAAARVDALAVRGQRLYIDEYYDAPAGNDTGMDTWTALLAIDLESGRTQWRGEIGDYWSADALIIGDSFVAASDVYSGEPEAIFDIATGKAQGVSDDVECLLPIPGGRVTLDSDGVLRASMDNGGKGWSLEADDGNTFSRCQNNTPGTSSRTAVVDTSSTVAYLFTYGGYRSDGRELVAVDLADGSVSWTVPVDGYLEGITVDSASGRLYIVDDDYSGSTTITRVGAVDASTGELLWSVPMSGDGYVNVVSPAKDGLWVRYNDGGGDYRIDQRDLDTGELVWSAPETAFGGEYDSPKPMTIDDRAVLLMYESLQGF